MTLVSVDQFRSDVVRGLSASPKHLPFKYFYDEVGSNLFEQIAELEESVGDVEITFRTGESIFTESSYKFDLDSLRSLAAAGGFSVNRVWTDERQYFSVAYLTL